MLFAAHMVVKYIPKDSPLDKTLESEDVHFQITGHTSDSEEWAANYRDELFSWFYDELREKDFPAGLYSCILLFTVTGYVIPSSPNGPEEYNDEVEPASDYFIERLKP